MKTDIRLIALDLDGTLLDSQSVSLPEMKLCCRNVFPVEFILYPCTGRIWGRSAGVSALFAGNCYAITTNGAIVEDVAEHRILDERKLGCAQAVDILELAGKFHTMYDAYVDGCAYGEKKRFMEHMDDYAIPDTIQTMILQTRQEVPDVKERIRILNLPVEKINYFFGDQQERARARRALQERGDVIVSSSLDNNLEINAPGATKGEAILRLAGHLGLRQSRPWDLEMVKRYDHDPDCGNRCRHGKCGGSTESRIGLCYSN